VAKPKKPSVSTTKVGLVKVQIETAVDRRTGKTRTRYRTYCTKAIVPKDQLEGIAKGLKLPFYPEGDQSIIERLNQFHLFSQGS
jgi:hypothetical protein